MLFRSMPSLDCSGSVTCGSSLLTPILYLAGVDLSTTLSELSSGKQATLTTSSALNVASVSAATVTATTGMTITGGRGNTASWGAQLRVVSSNSSILTAPPQITWGVNNEDLVSLELNYLGYLSHFWRSSAANAWSESSRVTSNNKWTFFSGITTPSDARLKNDVQDLPSEQCLHVLRQTSAVSYVRTDLSETTRRIGYIAQDVEAALGPSLANTNITDEILREISPGTTETLKTLAYDRMAVILWQCTRSLLARVEALEARVP